MNKAELNAFVKTDKVELPVVYREYLHVMDSPFGRKQISAAYDAAIKDRSLIGFAPSDLEIMHKFTESIPLCSWRDTDVTSLKIVNIGRKTAHNVKVFFPESGFAEITNDGTAVDSGKTKTP